MRRGLIRQGSPGISKIEELVAEHLKILPRDQRPKVAECLVEWWDRQVIYSLCGKRARAISLSELQQQIMIFVSEIEQDKLIADFENVNPPNEYQPDGMLSRQINLVNGGVSDLSKAIREEWRAREQRHKWATSNLAMAVTIDEYDRILVEYWSDRHSQLAEDCSGLEESEKCASGLEILRWTHNEAPNVIRPITQGWNAAYYVRGSYQVLAINLKVGWHPEYLNLLGAEE